MPPALPSIDGSPLGSPGPSWDQGDIVDAVYFAAVDRPLPGVLVTPACDIYQDKVDLWTFVALFPDIDVTRAILHPEARQWGIAEDESGRLRGLTGNQRIQAERRILELVTQRYPRYHWVPVPIAAHEAYVADFSYVTSVPAEEARRSSTRIARLQSSWREQLPARYVAFMGRVGTADLSSSFLDAHTARIKKAVIAHSEE